MKILLFDTYPVSELWESTCTDHLLSLKEQACVEYIKIYLLMISVPDRC